MKKGLKYINFGNYIPSILFGWLIISILVCVGCEGGSDIESKQLMYEHPEIRLQLNNHGKIYDKYSTVRSMKELNRDGEILVIYIGKDQKYEVFLNFDEYRQIGNTVYWVKTGYYDCQLRFQIRKPELKIKKDVPKIIKQKKEKIVMGLSLGTWIMLIIVMVIVAKIAHKLSLKTIFRPTKKAAKKIKTEWDES
jgi:hypothetical protein